MSETTRTDAAAPGGDGGDTDGGAPIAERVATWADDRLRSATFLESARTKVFPTHWSFLLGELALYSLVVVIISGTILTLFYVPSSEEVVYTGSYEPLQGLEISRAYESVLNISFDVPGGLLVRQVHHWGALLFMAATTAHLARVFFTGAFRKPRELNWVIGVTLLVLGMGLGFTGYSLPDDLLSGTGLVIAWSILKSIPVIGADLAFALIGGQWPGQELVAKIYPLHIFILPGALVAVLAAHLGILWRQKHTHEPGPGSTRRNIVGERLWPHYVLKSAAVFFATAGVLTVLGGAFQINPVWVYGPYLPADATTAAQPDWYIGFLEGALRLFPGWEFRAFGVTIPNPFFPGVLFPAIAFTALFAVPWIHRRLTGDHEVHHRIERPRDAPVRTGIGIAVIVGYVTLLLAGAQELIANQLDMPVARLTVILRIVFVLGPPLAGWLTWRITRSLGEGDPHPLRGDPALVLVRTEQGAYETEPYRVPVDSDAAEAEEEPATAGGGGDP